MLTLYTKNLQNETLEGNKQMHLIFSRIVTQILWKLRKTNLFPMSELMFDLKYIQTLDEYCTWPYQEIYTPISN